MGVSWQVLMDTANSGGWALKYITEFLGTAFLIMLGNGAVANVDLKGTKGNASGWLVIGFGYGIAVMVPALMFGNISGNHINPAFTIGLAVAGYFPWAHVAQYIIAQTLGAMVGQLVVVAVYRPYFNKTTNTNHILGSFSTIVNSGSVLNGFLNEFFGSFVLFFGALAITKNFFGAQLGDATASAGSLEVGHMALGFLVLGLVAAFGGATGPGLNPARDLGPRIVHSLLPKSVLNNKGDSQWWYAWAPVAAPIAAGIAATLLFKFLYGGLGA